MEKRQLNIELRSERGKNENYRLRQSGFIPAVLYSHGTSESIKVTKKDFFTLFKGHISESIIFHLVYKDISGQEDLQAFVKDYQVDPVTEEIIHLDLFKVSKDEKIQTHIPIELVGTPIGVKRGGVMEIYAREIEIECLPKDLPGQIEVNVSEIEEGSSIHAKDVVLGDMVKLLSNPDLVIVSVHVTRVIEETPTPEGETVTEEPEKETEE